MDYWGQRLLSWARLLHRVSQWSTEPPSEWNTWGRHTKYQETYEGKPENKHLGRHTLHTGMDTLIHTHMAFVHLLALFHSDLRGSVPIWLPHCNKPICPGVNGRRLNTSSWAGLSGWRHLVLPQHRKQYSWCLSAQVTWNFQEYKYKDPIKPSHCHHWAGIRQVPFLSLCNLFNLQHVLSHDV